MNRLKCLRVMERCVRRSKERDRACVASAARRSASTSVQRHSFTCGRCRPTERRGRTGDADGRIPWQPPPRRTPLRTCDALSCLHNATIRCDFLISGDSIRGQSRSTKFASPSDKLAIFCKSTQQACHFQIRLRRAHI